MLIDDDNAAWTRAGAFALAEYLEALEEDTGTEIEFCPCTLRCDYSEYADFEEWAEQFWRNTAKMMDELGLDPEEAADPDVVEEAIREFIQDRAQLIEFDGGVIVSAF